MTPGPKFELSDIRYIKRVVVGSDNPNAMRPEHEIEAAMELLNRCLSEWPRGTILTVEKSFLRLSLGERGEHQVVLQSTIYHVGFTRKPDWLTDVQPAHHGGHKHHGQA